MVLGTTNAALTLVLAMFLGGLGLGALLAGRSGGRLGAARLARRFLLLEIGAAGFAAGLPLYLGGRSRWRGSRIRARGRSCSPPFSRRCSCFPPPP